MKTFQSERTWEKDVISFLLNHHGTETEIGLPAFFCKNNFLCCQYSPQLNTITSEILRPIKCKTRYTMGSF